MHGCDKPIHATECALLGTVPRTLFSWKTCGTARIACGSIVVHKMKVWGISAAVCTSAVLAVHYAIGVKRGNVFAQESYDGGKGNRQTYCSTRLLEKNCTTTFSMELDMCPKPVSRYKIWQLFQGSEASLVRRVVHQRLKHWEEIQGMKTEK